MSYLGKQSAKARRKKYGAKFMEIPSKAAKEARVKSK